MTRPKPSPPGSPPAAPEPGQRTPRDELHWLFRPQRRGLRVNEHVRYERPPRVLDLVRLSRILRGAEPAGEAQAAAAGDCDEPER